MTTNTRWDRHIHVDSKTETLQFVTVTCSKRLN